MWPRTLDMTVDECRVVMRKLELEAYANVMSTFRAQGGLTQQKLNLLSDLRNIFNIDQDRHRAETRRVTNDEELTTIADRLFGDDCIIPWTREGKRGAPLLCRSKPYTTVTITANEAAAWVRRMNRRLPDPATVKRPPPPSSTTTTTTAAAITPPVVLADPLRAPPLHRPVAIGAQLKLATMPRVHRNATRPCERVEEEVKMGRRGDFVGNAGKLSHLTAAAASTTSGSGCRVPPSQGIIINASGPAATAAAATVWREPKVSKKVRKRKASLSSPPPPHCIEVDLRTPLHTDHSACNPLLPHAHVLQVAKSKRDISSNCQQLKQMAKPTAITTTTTQSFHTPPTEITIKQQPTTAAHTHPQAAGTAANYHRKGLKAVATRPGKDHPPPSKVQIIDQQMLVKEPPVAALPGNGSILFNRLQRTMAPKRIGTTTTTKAEVFQDRVSELKFLEEDRVSVKEEEEQMMEQLNGHSRREDVKRGDSGFSGDTMMVDNGDELVEVVIKEDVVERVAETTEDIYCCDPAEIIEEEVVMVELDYEEDAFVVYAEDGGAYKENGSTEVEEEEVPANGTDYEFLLDTHVASSNQILVEEGDANGFSQVTYIQPAAVAEGMTGQLVVAGHLLD